MDILLTPVEVRILGALIEKCHTTPDYYPLSFKALSTACNQKSNRRPVMVLESSTILHMLDSLKQKGLVIEIDTATGRVSKYEYRLAAIAAFTEAEQAILCALFLRGPQTLGELRVRTSRLYNFADLGTVGTTMHGLMEAEDGPYAQKMAPASGRRECRYTHLLSGEPDLEEDRLASWPLVLEVQAENKRIEVLEQEQASLKNELNELKTEFAVFRKQFE